MTSLLVRLLSCGFALIAMTAGGAGNTKIPPRPREQRPAFNTRSDGRVSELGPARWGTGTINFTFVNKILSAV